MLTGLHVLLTYRCTHECDHCFLHCSPRSSGTFTIFDLERLLNQALAVETVEWIYFEGGEPFLYHPLLVEGVRLAKMRGFRIGAVTNAYWAESARDAEIWLRPLLTAGLDDLSISDDRFHFDGAGASPASHALEAAALLGIPARALSVPQPGEGDGLLYRGRAAEKLTDGLEVLPTGSFGASCPEALARYGRVHVDSFGNVHICQGISIGNAWRTPLREILGGWDPARHPIYGPIHEGGPALLAQREEVATESGYVSVCHLCYRVREALLDRYPEELAPPGAYGRPTADE